MTQFSGSCSFCQYIPNKTNSVGKENLVVTSVRVRCMACVLLCLQSNINCLQDPTLKLNKITELSILQILFISNHCPHMWTSGILKSTSRVNVCMYCRYFIYDYSNSY